MKKIYCKDRTIWGLVIVIMLISCIKGSCKIVTGQAIATVTTFSEEVKKYNVIISQKSASTYSLSIDGYDYKPLEFTSTSEEYVNFPIGQYLREPQNNHMDYWDYGVILAGLGWANGGWINIYEGTITGTANNYGIIKINDPWAIVDRSHELITNLILAQTTIIEPVVQNINLNVSPTELSFPFQGGSQTVSVSCNESWAVSNSADWIKCSPMYSRTATNSLTVMAEPNPTAQKREATITVYGIYHDVSANIHISQEGLQNQEMSVGGVSYDLNYATMTATVRSVDTEEADNGELVIPETLTVSVGGSNATRAIVNNTFTVTAIGDSILAKRMKDRKTLNSVSFPITIKDVSKHAFDSAMVKSIVWKSNAKMPNTAFQNLNYKLKNMLLYVNHDSIAPHEFSNKVLMKADGDSMKISKLVLHEASEFYCPIQFQADSVFFTHKFTMKTPLAKDKTAHGQGWETMVLPFDVEKISYKKNNTEYNLLPFDTYKSSHKNDDRPFWLYEWDKDAKAFKSATKMEANKPYLISMPNNSEYAQDYNIEGDVTFSATKSMVTNTSIQAKHSLFQAEKEFYTSYSYIDSDTIQHYNLYCLNSENEVYLHNEYDYTLFTDEIPAPGSMFILASKIKRLAYPFEGFIALAKNTSGARDFIEIDFTNGDTSIQGIAELLTSSTGAQSSYCIYNLAGQRIGQSDTLVRRNLPSGVYVVNGKKVILKR